MDTHRDRFAGICAGAALETVFARARAVASSVAGPMSGAGGTRAAFCSAPGALALAYPRGIFTRSVTGASPGARAAVCSSPSLETL